MAGGIRGGRKCGFPVRDRGRRSLHIADRHGVYSLAHRCYILKTRRYHRYRSLTAELAPVVRAYRSLQKLGMKKWAEYDEDAEREIAFLKHRLMDMYWDVPSDERRASAVEHYLRVRYKHRMLYPFLAFDVPVLFIRAVQTLQGKSAPTWSLLAYVLAIWGLIALAEKLVTHRWIVARPEIHSVLEFELTN